MLKVIKTIDSLHSKTRKALRVVSDKVNQFTTILVNKYEDHLADSLLAIIHKESDNIAYLERCIIKERANAFAERQLLDIKINELEDYING